MHTLIKTEFLKLRTARAPWVILGIQMVLIVAGMSGLAIADVNFKDPAATGAARLMICHAGMSSILMLVLGILAVTGEYRDGTITDTYLSSPRRYQVFLAKLAAYTHLGVVSGVLSAVTALVVAAIWFAVNGLTLDIGSGEVWQTTLGMALWMPLYAAIGVALGALVRNLALAITIGLVWIAMVEGVAISLLGDLGKWMPGMAGFALDNAVNMNLLPQAVGGLVLAGYAAAFAVAATVVTMRSDVA
jgi:ABC-2 type transport system permease protein